MYVYVCEIMNLNVMGFSVLISSLTIQDVFAFTLGNWVKNKKRAIFSDSNLTNDLDVNKRIF